MCGRDVRPCTAGPGKGYQPGTLGRLTKTLWRTRGTYVRLRTQRPPREEPREAPRTSRTRRGNDVIELSLATTVAAIGLGILLVGALAGTAGYAATIARRQTRLITELTERLSGVGPLEPEILRRVEDSRLRSSFERLAARLGEAWTLATMDLLTGVANRQALLTRLDDEIQRAARYRRQLSVALIDIDHFKRMNDSHGHAAGDLVLHAVATVLRESIRNVDSIGRYGGEEFMIIFPETDVDSAASIVEKLRRLVARTDVLLEDGSHASVTLSAGVSGGLGDHLRLDALVRDADAALYSAKALGRNQIYVFHEVEDERTIRRASIAPSAREAAVEVGRTAMGAATRALTDALDGRPGWAGGPSTMIASTAAALAQAIGLPEGEIERIRTASILHDLGKLAIPDDILSKPGELDEPEWRVVAEHPKIGQVVLEQAGALRDAATIVLHHHEWFDGRGYPHGLSGQDIPIGARIVAVADAYEAMVAGRPYRRAIAHQQAIAELRRHAGRQFDPEVVELFAALFEDGVPWPTTGHHHPHDHDAEHADRVRPMRHGAGETAGAPSRDRRRRVFAGERDGHVTGNGVIADITVEPGEAGPADTELDRVALTHARIHDELHARRMRSRAGVELPTEPKSPDSGIDPILGHARSVGDRRAFDSGDLGGGPHERVGSARTGTHG